MATTVGGIKNHKTLEFEVCGRENITLTQSPQLDIFYERYTGTTEVITQINTWFVVDSYYCVIKKYNLQISINGTYSDYKDGNDVTMISDVKLRVITKNGIHKT